MAQFKTYDLTISLDRVESGRLEASSCGKKSTKVRAATTRGPEFDRIRTQLAR